ncbi:cerebellin-1-like [Babylonia areolata]|uniref:cerebellin-1-like n=1 Tax=Babylonia areolata TaxID=304850 RepID=UPI003FD2AEF6
MFLKALILAATATAVTSLNISHDSLTLQSLLTLVQHQVTTMEQQAASIQSLQSQLTALTTSSLKQDHALDKVKASVTIVKQTVTERLDAFNAQLEAKANMTKVAFTAHMSTTGVNVGANGPFVFDRVITNIGDRYNNSSGIFVAPCDGVYVFSFIMINDGEAPGIQAGIEKDGEVLGTGTSDGLGAYNKWDDGSALVTTRLKKGDHVYVKRRGGGTRVYGNVYTNFSGFLLLADV